MTKLAASSGTVLYEADNKLYISKSGGTGASTFLFVCGLLAFILLANGMLQLTVFKNQVSGSAKPGIILILLGLVFTAVSWKLWQQQKKVRAVPLHQLKTICILDFERNNLLDAQQHILSPLSEVWLSRKMQLTSSSPELLLYWKGGAASIVKGNPFSGGTGDIEKILTAKGIRRK